MSAEVLVPAGVPIDEAAAWVGGSCWAELSLHQALTDLLAVVEDPTARLALWKVRAHRAAVAEEWHRRLPVLRERPPAAYVVSPGGALVALLAEVPTGLAAVEWTGPVLAALAERYRAHVTVAQGPADGPVASTLVTALAVTESDEGLLRSL